MELSLIVAGLSKVIFGLLIGSIGITTSARLVKRLIGLPELDQAIRERNVAVGLCLGAAIFAMGLLVEPAVQRTFNAIDLIQHSADTWFDFIWIAGYALGLSTITLVLGASVTVLGVQIAVRLTPDLDEIAEIAAGNIASAAVLVAVVTVLALLARDGVDTLLTGFLPIPTLGRDGPS